MSQQSSSSFDTPHFVSLVLNSKKALQHGEQLCSKAHDLSFETTQVAAELMSLDAKAWWISRGILDQLKVRRIPFGQVGQWLFTFEKWKLASSIGSSIEAQRSRLEDQAKVFRSLSPGPSSYSSNRVPSNGITQDRFTRVTWTQYWRLWALNRSHQISMNLRHRHQCSAANIPTWMEKRSR